MYYQRLLGVVVVRRTQLITSPRGTLEKVWRIDVEIRSNGRRRDAADARRNGFVNFGNRSTLCRHEIRHDGISNKTGGSTVSYGNNDSHVDV